MTEGTDFKVVLDTIWVLFSAALVFFMNLGFGLVESGLTRSKNTVNILFKNFIVFAIASLAYWVVGFGLMFGDGNWLTGTSGLFGLGGADNSPLMGGDYAGVYSALSWSGIPLEAKFFFQLVFAGTAATIVSGAVAERIKFGAFIAFSAMLVAFIYPLIGHWVWGGGWLAGMGFVDFAGSTTVHSVGGWAALAGVLLLGARRGRFSPDGRARPMPGHNIMAVTMGAFVLWLGWFGFNAGSTMAADPGLIAHICLTTNSAAIAGILSSTFIAWLLLKKPDLTMTANGCLGGLVAVTAGCAFVSVGSAIVIGFLAGSLVILGVLVFDRLKLDDPVGALSVHLVCGVFGTLCVGLFAQNSVNAAGPGDGLFFGGGLGLMGRQALGVASVGVATFALSFVSWLAIKALLGLRVSAEEEELGLDMCEHGMEAYPGYFEPRSADARALPSHAVGAQMIAPLGKALTADM
jgi:Amt family ammonium transporter